MEPGPERQYSGWNNPGAFAVVSRCTFKRLTQEEWKASCQRASSSLFRWLIHRNARPAAITLKGEIENFQYQLWEHAFEFQWRILLLLFLLLLLLLLLLLDTVSCHRPFPHITSPETTVIPTAQSSSFRLQYFPYCVWRSMYSCLCSEYVYIECFPGVTSNFF
jgi:hypothetical protein